MIVPINLEITKNYKQLKYLCLPPLSEAFLFIGRERRGVQRVLRWPVKTLPSPVLFFKGDQMGGNKPEKQEKWNWRLDLIISDNLQNTTRQRCTRLSGRGDNLCTCNLLKAETNFTEGQTLFSLGQPTFNKRLSWNKLCSAIRSPTSASQRLIMTPSEDRS